MNFDFNQLKPDFNAIAKTDWAKPQFDTTDIVKLIGTAASVLMLIFVFCPWFGVADEGESVTRSGISLWYGILGLLAAVATIASFLYNHKALAVWTAVVGVIFAIIGLLSWPDLTVEGLEIPGDLLKMGAEAAKMEGEKVDIISWGAIMYLLSALVAGAAAFANVIGFKINK